jgi:hypothetical protein
MCATARIGCWRLARPASAASSSKDGMPVESIACAGRRWQGALNALAKPTIKSTPCSDDGRCAMVDRNNTCGPMRSAVQR